ncbi:hypothetical protein GCM10023219_00410 [Stakelama sediminis]|uniref:Uncharacterized protein n=1 Tax=Stakelama sediminis TaxID=463200 RepID=A0A840Z1F7_9SPHN|nr:hypothetical protein [Stakelama sediminis]MBB5719522.1 hypothetical protein [Stakelama sediminis]
MDAYQSSFRLKAVSGPALAVVSGIVAAAALLAIPRAMVERAIMASGLPAVLPAAAPPLGMTARIALAVIAGLVVAGAFLGATALLSGMRRGKAEKDDSMPTIRRADAHPDAPPRAPLRAATDLAASAEDAVEEPKFVAEPASEAEAVEESVMEAIEERSLPHDLDQPLSAYDPQAIPEMPVPSAEPVRPLARHTDRPRFEAHERIETFELTPTVRPPQPEPDIRSRRDRMTAPETEATIHALLERLERGVARRGLRPRSVTAPSQPMDVSAPKGLNETLESLRKLAVNS